MRMLPCFLLLLSLFRLSAEEPKPLFKDFIGVNGHTVQFKPELYKPVCRLVRDYHPVEWDLGNDTSFKTVFPEARNRVNWNQVYASWKKSGYVIDACLMIESIKHDKWQDPGRDGHAYGLAFAKAFGPSSPTPLVSSIEIGNEPGSYDDRVYRALFEPMARGVREGDPKLTIVTCATVPGKSHAYAKSLNCFEGLSDLYDVINIHVYAEAEPWPTWRRSYPEDPKLKYLTEVGDALKWRDEHAPGKPLWITEFGWDASTKPAPKTGTFAKWQGSTETQQAQWLVRSFLVFSKMPVARAYIYFFNDKDEPQVHGASGLTRDFKPKPAYHAVAHLQKTLGEFRFSKVIQEKTGDTYAYEFVNGTDPTKKVWAIWSATNSDRSAPVTLPLNGLRPEKTERMPLNDKAADTVEFKIAGDSLEITAGETPVFIWMK